MTKYGWILLVLSIGLGSCGENRFPDPDPDKLASYVDPYFLTGGIGVGMPMATVPFGMVRVEPVYDSLSTEHGFVKGFRHLGAFSGTPNDLGDFLIMPTTFKVVDQPGPGDFLENYVARFRHSGEEARPGYYSVLFSDQQIRAEVSASSHTGLHQYTFPKNRLVSIILNPVIPRDATLGNMVIRQENSNEVNGYQEFTVNGLSRKLYFVVLFSKPFRSFCLVRQGRLDPYSTEGSGSRLQAAIGYDTRYDNRLTVKVGFSTASLEGARGNIDQETRGWFLSRFRASAMFEWETRLRKIRIDADEPVKRVFYSAYYAALLSPNFWSDVYGEYALPGLQPMRSEGFDQMVNASGGSFLLLGLTEPRRAVDMGFSLIQPVPSGLAGRVQSPDFLPGILGGSCLFWQGSGSIQATVPDTLVRKAWESVAGSGNLDSLPPAGALRTFLVKGMRPVEKGGTTPAPSPFTKREGLAEGSDRLDSIALFSWEWALPSIREACFRNEKDWSLSAGKWLRAFEVLSLQSRLSPEVFTRLSADYVLLCCGLCRGPYPTGAVRFFEPSFSKVQVAPDEESRIVLKKSTGTSHGINPSVEPPVESIDGNYLIQDFAGKPDVQILF